MTSVLSIGISVHHHQHPHHVAQKAPCNRKRLGMCFNACQVDELAGAFEKVCEACSAFQDYVTICGFMGEKIEELHVFVKDSATLVTLLPPLEVDLQPAGQLEQSV